MIESNFKKKNGIEVPLDWDVISLGDIGEPCMCKRILKEQTDEDGDIPFYKIGTFGRTPDAYISKELFETFKSKYSYPQKGDILISAAGTIGRHIVFDGSDAYFQDSNIVWLDNNEKKITNTFLGIFLDVIKWSTTDGGTIKRLYNKNLKETLIVQPPVPEQLEISSVLSDMEELLSTLSDLITKKKNILQGAMYDLLSGKIRLPGFSCKWEKIKLKDICTFAKGRGLSKSKLSPSGKNECILYGEIFTTYDYSVTECKSRTNVEEGNPSKKGDVLMPASTTTCGIDLAKAVAIEKDGILLGGDIIIIRNSYEAYNAYFLACLITTIHKSDIEEVAHGTTIIHLRAKNIENLELFIPKDTNEQEEIAKIIADMNEEIEILEKRFFKYQAIKQGMMQQLLTGKIRLV